MTEADATLVDLLTATQRLHKACLIYAEAVVGPKEARESPNLLPVLFEWHAISKATLEMCAVAMLILAQSEISLNYDRQKVIDHLNSEASRLEEEARQLVARRQ